MSPAVADSRRWMAEATELFTTSLSRTTDEQLARATGLAGWTGKHLLAHVCANAEALQHLVHWARTGEETPMYSSPTQRIEDIEAGSRKDADELRTWYARSAAALDADLAALTDEQWQHTVVTAQGRTVPATELPWMRSREVMVHAVDLGGVGFADLPPDFCAALVADIVGKRSRTPEHPAVSATATDADVTVEIPGSGDPIVVSAPLAELTAWLAGRPGGPTRTTHGTDLPGLPAWL